VLRLCHAGVGLLLIAFVPASKADTGGWLPDWLSLQGEERYRVEVMDNTFRAVDPGRDQMTSSRFLLAARIEGSRWYAQAEFQDSRTWWHDAKTPVGTDDVNAAEWLQALLGVKWHDVIEQGDSLTFEAGRMTLAMGNSRVVGRNAYRNTINGFNGLRLAWRGACGLTAQAFYTSPMERLPNNRNRARLRDNRRETDAFTRDQVFWGLEVAALPLGEEAGIDLYLVGFSEHDRPSLPALRRDIYTLGARAFDTAGLWQWEAELSGQWGRSRSLRAAVQGNQEVRAWRLHAEISRGFEAAGSPRLVAKYDYASGDSNPLDGTLERYEATFAARRRDFGLLGIYGPLFYANLDSVALGVELLPSASTRVTAHWRLAALAERGDIFEGGALIDPAGASGRALGHFWDLRLDWTPIPDRLEFSVGGALLDKGEFLKNAPAAPANGDTVYGFSQFILRF